MGNYELRVCELVPYIGRDGADGQVMLVPSAVHRTEVVARTVVEVTAGATGPARVSAKVTPNDEVRANIAAALGGATRVPHPEIAGCVAAYESIAEPGTSQSGRAPDYRFVRVDDWLNGNLHYEFLHRKKKGELSAELHFESEDLRKVSDAVRDANLQPTPELPGLVWDQTWLKGKGRLRVVFPETTAPDVVARTMVALIRKTRPIVDAALNEQD